MRTKHSLFTAPLLIAENLDHLFKNYFQIVLFFLLTTSLLFAQEISLRSDTKNQTLQFLDSLNIVNTSSVYNPVITDTTIQVVKPKLLPDNMSFMEKGLWGEHGLFRGIGLAPELTRESRKNELQLRRTMLSIHQIGGFTSLGLMLATCYYGQRIIDGGVQGRRDFQSTKNTLVFATITSYSLTALLSILSPPPMIRRDEISTTSIHKTLAWFHVAGMIVTPILGRYINTNRVFHMDRAHFHQIAAYEIKAYNGCYTKLEFTDKDRMMEA